MNFIYFTLLFPLAGFLLLSFSRGRWSENFAAIVGVGSIGLAALTTVWIVLDFFCANSEYITYTLWNWITVDNFSIPITISIDGLSITMLSVVTGIGFIIHIYASWYMRGEDGYSRFFAYTNLFITSMIVLVLADNLLLMYLGWEGVGLCSYLLIGFYYTDLKNSTAAIKAFIITRIGDALLAIGLFILYDQFRLLNLHDLMALEPQKLLERSSGITWATLMLLGGSIGKSAQIPLQTWLVDAMVSPTPVSALIHAATMVTAGVYLIARTHGLFLLATDVLHIVGIIGAATLVIASLTALVQTDIKKVLAYSTMSQLGYMFLSLGVQAWDAAIYHLITHAFFKSLLFLASGSVIKACNQEQNIFKMGGLRKSIPFVYTCFLVGGAALSSVPLISAGFYSKDKILLGALVNGHSALMFTGLLGSFITSLYTFRMIFIIFHGEEKIKAQYCRNINQYLPLLLLLVLSTFIGAWITPPIDKVIPTSKVVGCNYKLALEIVSGTIAIIGIGIAAALWLGQSFLVNTIDTSIIGHFFTVFSIHSWGLDWFYDKIFVKPYLAIARLLLYDPLNVLMNFTAILVQWVGHILTLSENGQLRWYIASMVIGAVLLLASLILV